MGLWDDLIIGTGNRGNSAVNGRMIGNTSISYNSVSYWISGAFLDVGMTVMKDTPEGQCLTTMMAGKDNEGEIQSYLTSLVLTKVPQERLVALIEAEKQDAFEEGRRHQAALIRAALTYRKD